MKSNLAHGIVLDCIGRMAENANQSHTEILPIGIQDLYNSSPSKIQPWMQETGGIPKKATLCGGPDNPEKDSTHGIRQGSFLIMANAPVGVRPKMDF